MRFTTALMGARVKFIEQGEPIYGVIVQVTAWGRCIVACESGNLVDVKTTKLQLTEMPEELFKPSPYRGGQ